MWLRDERQVSGKMHRVSGHETSSLRSGIWAGGMTLGGLRRPANGKSEGRVTAALSYLITVCVYWWLTK